MQPDRQEMSDRMARRFAAMNEPEAGPGVAFMVVVAAVAVAGLMVGWALSEWWTALNAAKISVGL